MHSVVYVDFRMDIIAVRSPIEPDKSLCKRVLGMPGETVVNIDTGELVKVQTYINILDTYHTHYNCFMTTRVLFYLRTNSKPLRLQ